MRRSRYYQNLPQVEYCTFRPGPHLVVFGGNSGVQKQEVITPDLYSEAPVRELYGTRSKGRKKKRKGKIGPLTHSKQTGVLVNPRMSLHRVLEYSTDARMQRDESVEK